MIPFQKWDLRGKVVLLRLDLNCPLAEGKVADDFRIRQSLPTIQTLVEQGARVVVMSHLGRPKGRIVAELSLAPVRDRLAELLGRPVAFSSSVIGPEAKQMVESLGEGDVGMLENLRFEEGEEKDDPSFAEQLAQLGDFYINDAFGCSHRAHASVHELARKLPASWGLLMEKELQAFSQIENPKRPFVVLLGGAKLKTKLPVLEYLLERADTILLGGAMSYTFLKTKGETVGQSLVEEEFLEACQKVLEKAQGRIYLPQDHVVAPSLDAEQVDWAEEIPSEKMALDLGWKTVQQYGEVLRRAETVVWNGPLGVFERPPFSWGTHTLAWEIARLSKTTIAGGGDVVAALRRFGLLGHFHFVSTGGGAFLELLSGRTLPGISVLKEQQ